MLTLLDNQTASAYRQPKTEANSLRFSSPRFIFSWRCLPLIGSASSFQRLIFLMRALGDLLINTSNGIMIRVKKINQIWI